MRPTRIPKNEAIKFMLDELFRDKAELSAARVGEAIRARFLPGMREVSSEANRSLGNSYITLVRTVHPNVLVQKRVSGRFLLWMRAPSAPGAARNEGPKLVVMTWEEACAKSAYFQALETAAKTGSRAGTRHRDTAKLAFFETQRLVHGKSHLE